MNRDRNIHEVLARYQARVQQFDEIAARRGTQEPDVIELRPAVEQTPSARELDVLELVAQGFSNKEIGGRLFVSEDTIKTHIRNLLVKLRARNRAHAVALGLDRGLFQFSSVRLAA
jgi:ATP/maltotriose-dependent transcriptional regulator MalT